MQNLYEINFKVGRKQYRWCRFADTITQAEAEVLPAIDNEFHKAGKIISVKLTTVAAEENR